MTLQYPFKSAHLTKAPTIIAMVLVPANLS